MDCVSWRVNLMFGYKTPWYNFSNFSNKLLLVYSVPIIKYDQESDELYL